MRNNDLWPIARKACLVVVVVVSSFDSGQLDWPSWTLPLPALPGAPTLDWNHVRCRQSSVIDGAISRITTDRTRLTCQLYPASDLHLSLSSTSGCEFTHRDKSRSSFHCSPFTNQIDFRPETRFDSAKLGLDRLSSPFPQLLAAHFKRATSESRTELKASTKPSRRKRV